MTAPDPHLTCTLRRRAADAAVDAQWDKPAWADADVLTVSHPMGDPPEHRPLVQVKVAWDDDNLYAVWRVEDRYVVARRTQHQHPVCLDSCVEWFFTPHEHRGEPRHRPYFNLEVSCTGVMWLARNVPGVSGDQLPPEDLARIEIAASLTGPIVEEIATPTVWTLEYRLPLAVLRKHADIVAPAPGVRWRGNFYKCADESSHPHWLTWSPVDWPAPAFHMPKDFGTLVFE